ncbi:glycosyltransferase family protein [Actinopolymorpha alba]|uniref:glycosyltransferase family protein n=1 Tax=Actinopolymorpha alba TaxID=533267 RepID=UPI0003640750|nr:glycosyltransferase [Actinopolymorpha alba]
MVNTSEEARLLVYTQDGLGLGHLRRTTLLATEFLRSRPYASTLTISDSPLGQFFTASSGHDYLKLPSIRKTAPGRWQPIALASPFDDVLALRREIIRSAVLKFQPHVLLVDHMPSGAMGELVPALEAIRSRPVRVVLGLRDILDAPATVRRRWRLEGAFEAVERFYDDVLVYGSRDVFDVAAEYGWPAEASRRIRYCGYVCSPPGGHTSDQIRRRYLLNRPDDALIVAMAGGGADAFPLFDALLRAVPRLTAHRPCTVVIVTGPFLPEVERLALRRRARDLPVHVITSVPDSLSYLGAADVVVGMAGYNTTSEILSLRKPALLVPRRGPSAEQQMRARLFAERGWVRWVSPDHLDADAVGDAVLGIFAGAGGPPLSAPDLNGRQVAAERLLAGLQEVVPTEPPAATTPGSRENGTPKVRAAVRHAARVDRPLLAEG